MSSSADPRQRVLKNVDKVINKTPLQKKWVQVKDPPLPLPGDMQLYSFYAPGLEAKTYTITATQDIEVPPYVGADPGVLPSKISGKTNKNPQQFEVVAPEFSLDPAEVHSTYPPQGHGDQARTLPHIVLTDPHLPWEREAVPLDESSIGTFKNTVADALRNTVAEPLRDKIPQPLTSTLPEALRNRVPWLALLVFDADELTLSADILSGTTKLLTDAMLQKASPTDKGVPVKQSSTFAVSTTVGNFVQLQNCAIPYTPTPELVSSTEAMDVIFLKKDLFNSLMVNSVTQKADLTKYQYLAHVRNVNTLGMADAGVEDQGLYSLVISHRTGPTTFLDTGDGKIKPLSKPTTQIVHLLSLSGIGDMALPVNTDLVGLVSLYSWTYTCLPADTVNFVDTMRAIGDHSKTMLRCSDSILNSISATPEGKRVASRLELGYSLVRYRVQTGEETVAFNRGPFVPTLVLSPISDSWPTQSNFSTDYQILDPDLGVLDISYSSAWQLGKALALADKSFSAALMRLRELIHTQAAIATRDGAVGGSRGTAAVLNHISTTIAMMKKVGEGGSSADANSRWGPRPGAGIAQPPPLFNSPALAIPFSNNVSAQATQATTAAGSTTIPYNEFNKSSNPDWVIVFKWILDKLYLNNIPAYYLITDPSYLPPESIRFFYIDPNWTDALIDGALSIANHLSRDDDYVRMSLKTRINEYLKTEIDPLLGHLPQVPTYGFLLRSTIVSTFPDLHVEVPFKNPKKGETRADVLLLENIDKGVMLCLLDRTPDGGELDSIIIRQPPHQQCFSLGYSLNEKTLEFEFRRTYTSPHDGPWETVSGEVQETWTKDVGGPTGFTDAIYDWPSRTITFPTFATTVFNYVMAKATAGSIAAIEGGNGTAGQPNVGEDTTTAEQTDTFTLADFNDDEPTSAFLALQLNDPVHFITLVPPDGPINTVQPLSPRTLWTGKSKDSIAPPGKGNTLRGNEPAPAPAPKAPTPPTTSLTVLPPAPNAAPVSVITNPTKLPNEKTSTFTNKIILDPNQGGQFFLNIYTSDTPELYDPRSNTIRRKSFKTDNAYPIDIIFSLNLVRGFVAGLSLFELDITIPVGKATATRGVLAELYTGPGARMLSNQRWVVRVDQGSDAIVCRLTPRSLNKTVPIEQNVNLSFRLNQIFTTPWTQGMLNSVEIGVTETYMTLEGRTATQESWIRQGVGRNRMILDKLPPTGTHRT
jgi:hypothetical protein